MVNNMKIETAKVSNPENIELVLRRLNARDVFTVLSLLTDSVGTAEEVKKLFSGIRQSAEDTEESNFAEVGIGAVWTLLCGLLHKNQDDFIEWLASLVSMSREEFEKLPPSAVIEILSALRTHEDMADFFERLSEALSLFGGKAEESSINPELSEPTSDNQLIEYRKGMDGPIA